MEFWNRSFEFTYRCVVLKVINLSFWFADSDLNHFYAESVNAFLIWLSWLPAKLTGQFMIRWTADIIQLTAIVGFVLYASLVTCVVLKMQYLSIDVMWLLHRLWCLCSYFYISNIKYVLTVLPFLSAFPPVYRDVYVTFGALQPETLSTGMVPHCWTHTLPSTSA